MRVSRATGTGRLSIDKMHICTVETHSVYGRSKQRATTCVGTRGGRGGEEGGGDEGKWVGGMKGMSYLSVSQLVQPRESPAAVLRVVEGREGLDAAQQARGQHQALSNQNQRQQIKRE